MFTIRNFIVLAALVPLSVSAQQQCTRQGAGDNSEASAITRQQADAILDELKAIHRLLEERTPTAPGAPRPPAQVRLKNDPALPSIGREDAPLTLIEFSDYQCPFCKRFHASTFAELKKSFVDRGILRIVFNDLPLPMHADAAYAAEAAHCAADQGKFAPMHEALMNATAGLAPVAIFSYAREVGLNELNFKSCLETHKFKAEVQRAAADAISQSVSGTPTFVLARTSKDELTGDVLTGALPFPIFETAIKRRLEAK